MNKLALIAGVALLASCNSKAPAPDAVATADATMPMDAGMTPSAASAVPGSYDVTSADGSKTVDTLKADGTFVSRDAKDKVVDKGTWKGEPGKTCFTSQGKAEQCYTESAHAADGSFTATGADGKTAKVAPHAKM